jgi:hypothetical protein
MALPRSYTMLPRCWEREDANFADIVTRPESHADLTDLAARALPRGDLPEADGAYVVGV